MEVKAAQKHIFKATYQIFRLYYDHVGLIEAMNLMRGQNISFDLVKAIYDELSTNAQNLTEKRLSYYTMDAKRHFICYCFWTSRYLLVYDFKPTNSAFHEISLFDLFNDKSIKLSIQKSAQKLSHIYPLNNNFGLLEECNEDNSFISLISLDISLRSLKKLQTIEYPTSSIDIVVNGNDPTTFLLYHTINYERHTRIGKLAEETIVIEDVIEIDFRPHCFCNKCVYGLNWPSGNRRELDNPKIDIYDLEESAEYELDLDLPAGYTIDFYESFKCVRDMLFVPLTCKNVSYGVGYFDTKTSEWHILDFSLKSRIIRSAALHEGNFIFETQSYGIHKDNFYKVSFGKPDSLENTAWLNLVKVMKKSETIKDSYEAARQYLPPNSSINCPFDLSDEEEKDEPDKKRHKLE